MPRRLHATHGNHPECAPAACRTTIGAAGDVLGVPPEHRQQLRLWFDKQLERTPGDFHVSREGAEASAAIVAFYYGLVCERRAHPLDDMISRLTQVDVA